MSIIGFTNEDRIRLYQRLVDKHLEQAAKYERWGPEWEARAQFELDNALRIAERIEELRRQGR